jgi:hypothetical protein
LGGAGGGGKGGYGADVGTGFGSNNISTLYSSTPGISISL